jgi:acyl carrier protein
VRQIVGAYTEIASETIQEEHNLEADLGCDSLDVVEISMEVEEHFGISVPDEIEEQGRTVRDVVDGVLHLLGELPDD